MILLLSSFCASLVATFSLPLKTFSTVTHFSKTLSSPWVNLFYRRTTRFQPLSMFPIYDVTFFTQEFPDLRNFIGKIFSLLLVRPFFSESRIRPSEAVIPFNPFFPVVVVTCKMLHCLLPSGIGFHPRFVSSNEFVSGVALTVTSSPVPLEQLLMRGVHLV